MSISKNNILSQEDISNLQEANDDIQAGNLYTLGKNKSISNLLDEIENLLSGIKLPKDHPSLREQMAPVL